MNSILGAPNLLGVVGDVYLGYSTFELLLELNERLCAERENLVAHPAIGGLAEMHGGHHDPIAKLQRSNPDRLE